MLKQKKKSESSAIVDFLYESGFVLELETADFLEKQGYKVFPSQYFFDADEEKKREIDLIATKVVNGITLYLIIECKQNLGDDWVFICTQKSPRRKYNEFKHSPEIPTEILKNKEYSDLHVYNFKFSLAQNYLVYRREKGKKSKIEPLQITEAVFKLPKAVVWFARNKKDVPTIYLPVTLFNGKIFVANYDKKIIVKEKKLVQFQTALETPAYYEKLDFSSLSRLTGGYKVSEIKKIDPDSKIAKESAERLGEFYIIDFITKRGLKKYLNLIEKEVSSLDLKLWPVKNSTIS
ncbi:MAG: hypothetical protein WC587_01480 [Candidatus Paceibacterota bacterium]